MIFKKIALPVLLAVASVSVALLETTPAVAATSQSDNAEQRINFSGKLRMLSQRIPSAACHFSRGIDVEGASALLVGATAEFEKILTGLEFGDADLNIQNAETNRQTLALIADLRAKWEPIKAAAEAVAGGNATQEDRDHILNNNIAVLGAAQLLVERLVQQYSNPNATTFASLVLIDISGRQRMLTQKISKESCILGSDYDTAVTVDDLTETMRIFENSLGALRNGMSQVGVLPPPNEAISVGLDGVLNDWNSAKPFVTEVLAGNSLSDSDDARKFQQLNVTMGNMNRVVGLYVDAAATLVPLDNM